eukprot:2538122-Pleurochrysis_carterae.AAC.1
MQPPNSGAGSLTASAVSLSSSVRSTDPRPGLRGDGGGVEHCSRSFARRLRHRARALARVH